MHIVEKNKKTWIMAEKAKFMMEIALREGFGTAETQKINFLM